jgi:ABC-type branched-subunit amino acid transport system substrate-binding protein
MVLTSTKPTVTFLKFITSPLSISKRGRGWKFILCLFLLLFVQKPIVVQPSQQPEDTLLFREFDVSGLTFLGTNAWNGPDLISIAGKSAEGAIFVDAFFKKASSPLVARFVEEFQKAYQREPETLEALSYDGAKLLLEIIRSKGISSPIQMKDELGRFKISKEFLA